MSDVQSAIRQRAKELLESEAVGYVIGWEATRDPKKMRPAFVSKPEDADRLVWNEFCINSTAKYLLDDRWPAKKIAVCARGCDTRALNRMISDKQVQRENVYIIGLPCEGKDNQICERCAHKNPLVYDEIIGDPVPEAAAEDRFTKVEDLEKLSLEERQTYFEEVFSKCIHCYACRNVCPCCSCRECYADQYRTGWQGKQMNSAQNRFYGLTRALHVGDRCIECGECERVCPMDLPIMLQTGKILKDINELFGPYECGLSDEEVSVLGSWQKDDPDEFM